MNHSNESKRLLESQACPMTASVNWNPQEDTVDDTVAWYTMFDKLQLAIRLGLGADKVQQAVLLLAKSYRIDDPQRVGEISRIIREVFLKGLREVEIKQRVMAKLSLPGPGADHFMLDLRKVITFVKNIGQLELEKDTEKLDILSALKQYPEFGEIKVTERFIKLKMFTESVEPTIKNWLEDYFSRLGTDKHTSIERTEFLFNSENGKTLSSTEREKLSIILKSYDDGEPLMLDTETHEIVYSESNSENLEKKGVALPIESRKAPSVAAPQAAADRQSPLAEARAQYFQQKRQNSQPVDARQENNRNFASPKSDINNQTSSKQNKTFTSRTSPTNEPVVLKPLPKKNNPKEAAKNVIDLSEYM